jgi:hypothetical protein
MPIEMTRRDCYKMNTSLQGFFFKISILKYKYQCCTCMSPFWFLTKACFSFWCCTQLSRVCSNYYITIEIMSIMSGKLLFYVPLKNFSLFISTGEGLQNLVLCSALSHLIRKGSLSCHTCCDTGPRFFPSHPKDHPILVTHKGTWRTYSNPGHL